MNTFFLGRQHGMPDLNTDGMFSGENLHLQGSYLLLQTSPLFAYQFFHSPVVLVSFSDVFGRLIAKLPVIECLAGGNCIGA